MWDGSEEPSHGFHRRYRSAAQEVGQGLALLLPLVVLGGGGKEDVARGVQSGLQAVLDDAHDKAHAHHLHGNVVGNAEEGAGHGNQEEGTAGHARGAAGGQSGEDGQDQGGGEVTPQPEGTIFCTFDKSGTPSNDFFTVVGNGSNSKGTATVDGETYDTCLKMESSTNITFTLAKTMLMTLYFGDQETASIKVDGVKKTSDSSTYSQTLDEGQHVLTKADSRNLFGIKLEPVE